MLGAIICDTVGSRFEFDNKHTKDFEFLTGKSHPTDDSMMTIAIADAIMQWDNEGRPSYGRLSELAIKSMRRWGRAYPYAGYGGHFAMWLVDDSLGPYNGRIVPCMIWSCLNKDLRIVKKKSKDRISHILSLCNLFIYRK